MKKKESIIDVLKNGTSRTEKSMTEIVNGNFSCIFPKGEDVKIFADSLKKFDRKVKNVCEYGEEKGRAAVINQPNSTAENLAKLLKSPQDCRRYYAMYMEAKKAPPKLQPIVFYNLKVLCKEDDVRFVNLSCSFYLASILPPKYIKGWENEYLFGYDYECQVEDLTPTCGLEIGKTVWAKHRGEMMQGTIVGHEFLPEKIGWVSHSYSPATPYRHGRKVLHYKVQFSSKYDTESYKVGQLSFINRETA